MPTRPHSTRPQGKDRWRQELPQDVVERSVGYFKNGVGSVKQEHCQESGVLSQKILPNLCLLFENVVIWLMALQGFNVGNIYLPQILSFSHILDRLKLKIVDTSRFKNIILMIGCQKLCFIANVVLSPLCYMCYHGPFFS